MARIGFIGLGTMGRGMAANLLAGGHALHVYDVRHEAVEEFSARGAAAAASVAEAARNADAVVLMLPDTPQVEEVVLGPGGLVENPPAGRLVIDMSTISAAASRSMAARLEAVGTAMLDAPVSGGPQGAESGSLSIMAGGTEAGFAAAQPILAALGTTVRHVGPPGAGQTVKACNQLICALNLQAICEALALGRAAGLDLELLREVLLGGAASSWMLQNLGPKMVAKDASAGFRIGLKLKDLRLAGELGFQYGLPLPGLALATSLYLEARAHGEDANGNQALFRVYDRLTNQAGEAP
ncbi:NAD(P)-dependent oxidoreductase [Muricoccus aerilatus]|uniref:NAD(P)-dependent oxidoreductase n=1 Tax=Muricoccus aerilatus TaxID=452982 RepID=UPI0005C1BE03|nr:NAD(P)-dependent oxidoreductase [Roseomonas aerilata]